MSSELPFRSRRSAVYAANGMVATSQPLASEAGVAALRAGGNAVDAAATAAAVLAVTEPCSCGLGGDAFALCFDARDGAVIGLNGSGRAPAGLSLDRLRAEGFGAAGAGLPPRHPYTVTVPGAVAALCDLVEARGSLPLAQILGPAIELADRGFPVAPITAYHWQLDARSVLDQAHGGRELLLDGRAPRAGELIRNGDLADVLRAIAEQGKMPSTRETSPRASPTRCRQPAARCPRTTWPATAAPGTRRSAPRTGASGCGSARPTARGSRRSWPSRSCATATSLASTTRWHRSACTRSSRRCVWRLPTAAATWPIRALPARPWTSSSAMTTPPGARA